MVVQSLILPEDTEVAQQRYVKLRKLATKAFYAFLRNLNSQLLRRLEQRFSRRGYELKAEEFVRLFADVLPIPESKDISAEERDFIISLAAFTLFEDVDVTASGVVPWIHFVEFVVAKSETLRIEAEQMDIKNTRFDFRLAHALPYRPSLTKCRFDKAFYWPEHPDNAVVVFEEGQHDFHLHRPHNLQRRRRIAGHRSELLAAEFLPDPFNWVVTAANDKTVRFWDSDFRLVNTWHIDSVVGVLCWCHEINALYSADYITEKVQAWRLTDPLSLRSGVTKDKPDKSLEFKSGHSKSVPALRWISSTQCLATASLDTTVRLFDLVQLKRTHVLSGHSKGVTCLEYNSHQHMLISAGFDNYIILWDPGAGVRFATLEGHDCSITAIKSVPGTEHEILSLDMHATVKVWDLRRLACVQSWHAGDPQREKLGEIEHFEARTICCTGRDRFVVCGRRMELFERDFSDPRLTADAPITAMVFNRRNLQIAAPVKTSVRIWSALNAQLLTVHNNVIESNITAMTLDLGQRRLVVGGEQGQCNVLNYACGALLKSLHSHSAEVSQIQCIPNKILTLAPADKQIIVHADMELKRSCILKVIDLAEIGGAVLRMSCDGRNMLVASSEDSDLYWYNTDSTKPVSNTEEDDIKHNEAVPCCQYLHTAPLVVAADVECRIMFWSIQPLRPYDAFFETRLVLEEGSSSSASLPKAESTEDPQTFAIAALALSWPKEDYLFLGSDNGHLICICITEVIDLANKHKKEALLQRASSEDFNGPGAEHFDCVCKILNPCWVVNGAHRGGVEQVVFCANQPPVILSLGTDFCIRLWASNTGEALGTLEQGPPEGLSAEEQKKKWRCPIAAHDRALEDCNALHAVMGTLGEVRPKSTSSLPKRNAVIEIQAPHDGNDNSKKRLQKSQSSLSESLQVQKGGASVSNAKALVMPRYMSTKQGLVLDQDWLAGPFGAVHSPHVGHLPALSSGLRRPQSSPNNDVVQAARKLSQVLSNPRSRKL